MSDKPQSLPPAAVAPAYSLVLHAPLLRRLSQMLNDELAGTLGIVAGSAEFSTSGEEGADAARSEALSASEYAVILSRSLRYLSYASGISARMTDVSQLMIDTFVLFEKHLSARGIHAQLVIDSSSFIEVDPNALHQVVSTLLARSSKIMSNGGSLTVSSQQREKTVELTYVDSGPGKKVDWSDPGLAVARVLVETHGGAISADIKPRENRFVVRFPFDKTVPRPAEAQNKRRNRRAAVSLPIEILFPTGETKLYRTINLSVAGLFVHVPEPAELAVCQRGYAVGARLLCPGNVIIFIPRAEIANVRAKGAVTGMGLEFSSLPTKERKILGALVKVHPY